jgi:hypothetical protein
MIYTSIFPGIGKVFVSQVGLYSKLNLDVMTNKSVDEFRSLS